MKRKHARLVLTAALVLTLFILATRGVHFALMSHLPAHFTLKLDGNPWRCTSSGNVIDCTYSLPVHNLRPEVR